MKNSLRLACAAAFLASATLANAQVGKPLPGMLDVNRASEQELTALPGMNATLAKALIAKRPFASMLAVDSTLGALTKEQRATLYAKLWLHINLNATTREEILLIPQTTNRHVREFQEYAPYKALAVFHREMRKYWSEEDVSRLEAYVFVPLDLNTASDEDIMTIPGMSARMLREFKEYRPYDAVDRYIREMSKYVDAKEAARLARYVTVNK